MPFFIIDVRKNFFKNNVLLKNVNSLSTNRLVIIQKVVKYIYIKLRRAHFNIYRRLDQVSYNLLIEILEKCFNSFFLICCFLRRLKN